MNCALYARVSTSDQNCALQLVELRRYADIRAWKVAGEFVDTISGAKGDRPALGRLLTAAVQREFDVVLVWKLDRFGRSVLHLNQQLATLEASGVRFIAVSQGIDTDASNPMSRLLVQLLAAFAEFERELIRERVKGGQAAAKSKGVRFGRPKRIFRRDLAAKMRAEGRSWRVIARELDVPVSTLRGAGV
ncbi:MAG: recombinase family protein [Chthoniobacteraceae bacterium]|nr:recombinase family protein [Chthoniobacteraceae bacterium]